MIRILGTGLYAPGKAIDNAELKELAGIEFEDEKIEGKIGIRRRHIARLRNIDETTADFAEKAARAAIADAGLTPEDIGLVVVASDTPEYISPATSILVQGRLQQEQRYTGSFDVSASCSSFVAAFDTVSRIVATDDSLRYALVIGVYNMPAYLRPDDAFGYSIFADGAGAWVIGKSDGKSAYLAGERLTDGTQWDYIGVYAGGTRQPVTPERLASGEYGLQLLQRLPGDRNVNLWPGVVERLSGKAGIGLNDIDHILFTQINRSVIEKVMSILELPMEKTTCIMDRYGYTGSACVPMAFHTAVKEGRIRRGDTVAVVASGAGLAVAASAFRY